VTDTDFISLLRGEFVTYKDLKLILDSLNEEQLNSDICVHDITSDEYIPEVSFYIVQVTDVLDEGHPVISVKT
jgi:hypothetical protein